MLPHKPDMESERIRIQDQGGLVIYMDTWRVNGILSVTRAIGDPEHKSLIIADPSFSTFQIEFLTKKVIGEKPTNYFSEQQENCTNHHFHRLKFQKKNKNFITMKMNKFFIL